MIGPNRPRIAGAARRRKNKRENARRKKGTGAGSRQRLIVRAVDDRLIGGDVDHYYPLVDEWPVGRVGCPSQGLIVCAADDNTCSSTAPTTGTNRPRRKLGRNIFENVPKRVIFFEFY